MAFTAACAGFQSIGQVSGTYGRAVADTIVENCGNTLLLRCAPDGVHLGERGPGQEGVGVAETIREAGPEHVVTIERRSWPEQARLEQRPPMLPQWLRTVSSTTVSITFSRGGLE